MKNIPLPTRKTLQSLTHRLRFFKDFLRSPVHVWKLVLLTFFIINLIVLSLSFYLFIQIGEDEAFSDDGIDEGGVETINRSELDSFVKQYERRRARFEDLIEGNASPFPNPL